MNTERIEHLQSFHPIEANEKNKKVDSIIEFTVDSSLHNHYPIIKELYRDTQK
jgi:hypothetical protein